MIEVEDDELTQSPEVASREPGLRRRELRLPQDVFLLVLHTNLPIVKSHARP